MAINVPKNRNSSSASRCTLIRNTPCDSKFEDGKRSGNQSAGMNQTQGLPVDKWIIVLKKDNPTLATIEQSPDVKDAIGKIRAMQDPNEAVKTFNALNALQQL